MFDLFGNEQSKPATLRTIDYRNAKYHGHTVSNEPQGLGILLDHHYLLAISQWDQAVALGPTFALYPDGTTFHGAVTNQLPNELCTYTNNKGISICVDFKIDQEIKVAIDSLDTNTLHFIRIKEQVYRKLLQSTDEDHLLKQYLRDQRSENVVFKGQKTYTTHQSKIELTSKFFERTSDEIIDYRSFIRRCFGNRKQQGLEIVESKQDFSFHFKHTSITCKISNGNPRAIKSIGYFNSISREMQIERKDLGTANLQQVIDSAILQYPKMPAQRPFDCLNFLHQHYKKSLGFRNKYFCVDYIYRIKFIFHSIEQLFSDISTKTLAQQLLENPIPTEHCNKHLEISRQDFSTYAIQKVKEDVYRAARKKSVGHITQSTSQNKSKLNWRQPSTQEISRHTVNHSFSFKEKKPTVYQQIINPKTSLRDQKKVQQMSHPSKSTSYNYLGKTQKNLGTPVASRAKRSPLSKYAYLEEESERVNQKRIQNIKNLTAFYEGVQREVRYKFFNGSDEKSTKWQESPATELGKSKVKFQGSPNGPKRMLKYGWD